MKYIDLSHTFNTTMSLYPNSNPPIIEQIASVKENGYHMTRYDITTHLGTHLDAPAHMIEGGKFIHEVPIDAFQGKGIVIDCRNQTEIGLDLLQGKIEKYDVVLLYSGWEHKFFEESYYYDYPVLTKEAAEYIVSSSIKIVGVDYFSVDTIDSKTYDVHQILLGNDLILYENLCHLSQLIGVEFHFYGFPVLVEADGFPVRPVAAIDSE